MEKLGYEMKKKFCKEYKEKKQIKGGGLERIYRTVI
jgi:hypothetical protein